MPYWRLSAFYFCYYATLGALVPYWAPYLRSLGFSAADIGALMATIIGTKIVAPNLWAWIADRSGHCMPLVRAGSVAMVVCFTGVFLTRDFWGLALVMAGFSFFWNAVLPQIEATTMNHLGRRVQHYGRIRLWGSIGFILAVAALGPVLDREGVALIRPVVLMLMCAIFLSALLVPESPGRPPHEEHIGLGRLFRRPHVLAFLGGCLLMQASHAPYYTFYTIYLGDLGYSHSASGFLWALGVICEVGMFLLVPRLFARVGVRRVLLGAFLVAALRWTMIGAWPHSLVVLLAAQTLHAITFGAFHAAAIHSVHGLFTGRHQHRGQALYSSVSFGAGGALGSLGSGYLWEAAGAQSTWLIAAGLPLLAWGLVRFGMREGGRPA